jgi:hypothetical protein
MIIESLDHLNKLCIEHDACELILNPQSFNRVWERVQPNTRDIEKQVINWMCHNYQTGRSWYVLIRCSSPNHKGTTVVDLSKE